MHIEIGNLTAMCPGCAATLAYDVHEVPVAAVTWMAAEAAAWAVQARPEQLCTNDAELFSHRVFSETPAQNI